MKSVDERKRRLIGQISHLKKEVDKLIQSPKRNRIYPPLIRGIDSHKIKVYCEGSTKESEENGKD